MSRLYGARRLLLLAALLAIPRASAPGPPPPLPRWYPLDVGNRWVYENQGAGLQAGLEIIVTGVVGDTVRVVFQQPGEDSNPPLFSFEKLLSEKSDRIEIRLPEEDQLQNHYIFGESGWIHRDTDSCDDRRTATIVSESAVVETPAGTFEGALEMTFGPSMCSDGGTVAEFFAKDIGLVKSTFETILGERSWVLRSFETLPVYRRGDTNADAELNLSDAVFLLAWLFTGGEEPACIRTGDANDDDVVDISDALAILNYLFIGTQAPPEPFQSCGVDRYAALLPCRTYEPCRG
jgi:hypothetical protein